MSGYTDEFELNTGEDTGGLVSGTESFISAVSKTVRHTYTHMSAVLQAYVRCFLGRTIFALRIVLSSHDLIYTQPIPCYYFSLADEMTNDSSKQASECRIER